MNSPRRAIWPALLLAALGIAGCGARAQPNAYPITIEATPIAAEQSGALVGRLVFAGGLSLKAQGTDSFGGVSGLDVDADGRFVAVSDAGDLISGRIAPDGTLPAITDATIRRLVDEAGQPFQRKVAGDAEDVTLLEDGGFAVAFEQDHRILVYPASGPPRRLPVPSEARLGRNSGIEALAQWRDPATGVLRLVIGAERGDAWACDMEGLDCRKVLEARRDNPGPQFRLTGLDALPDGRLVAVYRAVSILTGLQAVIAEVRPGAERPVTELARLPGPLVSDNMEAIAAVAGPDSSVRLYVGSDDNFSGWQKTLLLAFDWPAAGLR